jgi:glycosyltransferase involved in cell wall biosynthesis
MGEPFDVSAIICTYNRGILLRPALESLLAQDAGAVSFEVIIVDNNSTDDTKRIALEFIAGREGWTYVFEGQQGLSHARNAGVGHARAPIVAFTDDDVRVAPNWVREIKRSLDAHPEAAFVGGRVLPRWSATPPRWLTKPHWVPLAIVDHGDEPFYVDESRPWCMVGANLSIRTATLQEAGGFAPRFQRVKDTIGSTEDHELQFRLWRAGLRGMYVPTLRVEADVQPDRLRKAYHRRWHAGHARFSAMMGTERISDDMPELFGMPACFIRLIAWHVAGWVKATAGGREALAFRHENKIRFLINYAREHRSARHGAGTMKTLGRTLRGVRELVRRKLSSRPATT